MKKISALFVILFQLFGPVSVIADEAAPPLYIFQHNDVGTIANYILLNGVERGIKFDESSNQKALAALGCLKPSIFLPNSSDHQNIVLEGKLHPGIHRTPEAPNMLQSEGYQYFTLHTWYILVPFTENTYYSSDNPLEENRFIIARTSLNKDDFDCETEISIKELLMSKKDLSKKIIF